MKNLWWFGLVPLLAATACGDDGPGELRTHRLVKSYRASAPHDFAECGIVELDFPVCPDAECEARCTREQLEGLVCFARGWDACIPTHLQTRSHGRGGTTLQDYFVVPAERGCEIVKFDDWSHLGSEFCGEVSRETCRAPAVVDGPESCGLSVWPCFSYETLVVTHPESCEE